MYVAAHVGLRTILAQQYGMKIAGNDFSITPTGKPFLAGGPEFSLSRSGLLALVAISEVSHVGVDVEQMHKNTIKRWAIRYPVLRLFALSTDYDQPETFLHAWVRLEAWCKRRAMALSTILDNGEAEFLRIGEELGPFNPASELRQLDVPSGHLAWCACDLNRGILQKQLDF
jgi:4'-phosphopantetheinyl transferase